MFAGRLLKEKLYIIKVVRLVKLSHFWQNSLLQTRQRTHSLTHSITHSVSHKGSAAFLTFKDISVDILII